MKCSKCDNMPKESDQFAWKCNSCKKVYKVSMKFIQGFAEKKQSGITEPLLKCKECGAPLDDGAETIGWKCSCGNVQKGNLKDYIKVEKTNPKLINCPGCGKEISGKANRCVHCGKVLIENLNKTRVCVDCGRDLPLNIVECPFCGCPIEKIIKQEDAKPQQVEFTSIKMAAKTKKIIIGIIIAIIICAGGGVGYKIYSDNEAEQFYRESYNEYIDNLGQVQILMLSGGSDAESLCNLTLRVWGNAIYEDKDNETDKYTRPNGYFVSDFNEALGNLYADSATKDTIDDIENNQASVKELIKKLQNPSEGLDKCYDTVSDLYEAYKTLTDLAINPSGNYSGFSTKKSDAVSKFMSSYEKMDNQIPEKLKDK